MDNFIEVRLICFLIRKQKEANRCCLQWFIVTLLFFQVHFLILQDTVSVHRPGFYAHRFLDFMADKVFKKIPSRKDHFRFSPRSAYSSFSITTSARFYNVMVLNPASTASASNTKLTLTNAEVMKPMIMASAGTFNVLLAVYLVSSPNKKLSFTNNRLYLYNVMNNDRSISKEFSPKILNV